MKRIFFGTLFGLAVLTTATTASAQKIELSEIEAATSSRKTDAQKDIFWKKAKGKEIVVVGSVKDVEAAGWLMNARIEIDVDGSDTDVSCYVSEEHNKKVLVLDIGTRVLCRGAFFTYSEIFGLHVSIDDANPFWE